MASEITDLEVLLKCAELSKLTPKQKDLVLFIGRRDGCLIDNAKHCFVESRRGKYKFKSIFFTTKPEAIRELKAHNLPCMSAPDLEVLRKVALVVCDDFHWRGGELAYLTHGSKIFQLWHGIPLKSIGIVQANTPHNNMAQDRQEWLKYGYSGYDAVLSTSEFVSKEIFSQAFATKSFVEFGYPRNDVMLRRALDLDKFDMINVPKDIWSRLKQHRSGGGKVVVYMPTFRDYTPDGTLSGQINSGCYLDFNDLSAFGRAANVIFLIKFHPYVQNVPEKLPENCIFCPHDADIYPLLRFADVLLTDFSSIYFDYLLLNRPIHFHVPDKEEYEQKDRKFLLNFDEWTPGSKSRTTEECFGALAEILANGGDDGFESERLRMRDILFKYHDDQAAARCCEFVEQLIA